MTEQGLNPKADAVQPTRTWAWTARRIFGLAAPLIVVTLAVLIYLMFAAVPEDGSGMIDTAILYGAALLCPMGLIAFAGYACANSTRGNPAPRLAKISSAVNLLLTSVLIVPAVCVLPLFLLAAPIIIRELFVWIFAH